MQQKNNQYRNVFKKNICTNINRALNHAHQIVTHIYHISEPSSDLYLGCYQSYKKTPTDMKHVGTLDLTRTIENCRLQCKWHRKKYAALQVYVYEL